MMIEDADSPQRWANFSENPALLRLIYDVDPALVFVKDRQGRFVFANKALADIYGSTVDNLLGKTDADFNPDIDEIEHFLTDDIRVMDSREELFIAEERVTDAAENTVWLQTTKRPLIESNGECDHVLGVSFDITGRKQAEYRERELQSRLARAQRMESLGVMAGGVAHDLNNILGPLIIYPELIRRRLADDPKTIQLLSEITQATSRATAVIQDLLTLARRGTSELQQVDLNCVVSEFLVSASFRGLHSHQPEIDLHTDLEEQLPAALALSSHCYQIVMNLVTNAFEAMPYGGRLTVATRFEKREAGFTAYSEIVAGDYIILEITDTGVGIPAERLNSIFEPFSSSKALGRSGSGSGLGLAVVYGVLQDMNGFVDVQRCSKAGTRFVVGLPSFGDNRVNQKAPDIPCVMGTETILIVDDLASQRTLGLRVLEALGYKVLTAENCCDALSVIRESPAIGLVLVDMLMADHPDGLETFRTIQAIRPGLPCIIVSGYAESDRIRTACAEGALGFVKKPYTQQVLGRAIRAALDSEPPASC